MPSCYEMWREGLVRIACDNSSVVDALNKHSIKGLAIVSLQRIFLIASIYDIQIFPFWIPSKENMVADAASRYDYTKLANLGLQVSQDLPRPAVLRRKLHSFFTTPSLQVHGGTMRKSSNITSPSAGDIATFPTQPPSKRYRTGLLNSSPPSNPLPQNLISGHSNPSTFEPVNRPLHLRTNASTSSLGVYGELTWDTWCTDSHRLHLSRKHVVFQPDGSVILTLPASKVDQFHVGVEIYLAQSPLSPLCPVTALRALFHRYPAPPHAPLFIRPFSQPFDKSFFVHAMHHLLLNAGISTVGYSGHSLRKGVAVTADRNGISRPDIKLLGRWKSAPWTSTLTNVKSLTISGKSSISTPSFSPLFTNLSGIVDGHANSLGLLVLFHAPAAWPVETCREASLNHKAAAIHQKHFPYDHHFVIVKRELERRVANPVANGSAGLMTRVTFIIFILRQEVVLRRIHCFPSLPPEIS